MKKQNEFRLALSKTNSSRNINLARRKLVFLFDVHISEVCYGGQEARNEGTGIG